MCHLNVNIFNIQINLAGINFLSRRGSQATHGRTGLYGVHNDRGEEWRQQECGIRASKLCPVKGMRTLVKMVKLPQLSQNSGNYPVCTNPGSIYSTHMMGSQLEQGALWNFNLAQSQSSLPTLWYHEKQKPAVMVKTNSLGASGWGRMALTGPPCPTPS